MSNILTPPGRCGQLLRTTTRTARILVVEDDPDLRTALEVQLRSSALQAISAKDGRQALDMIAHTKPDVMVLDLGLPGVDGLDLLDRLREMTPTPPAVIVLSAWDEQRCEPLALARGAALYFEKPVEFGELLAGIRYLLEPET